MSEDTIFTKDYFIDDDEKFRWLLEVEMLLTMCYELAEWLNSVLDDENITFDDFFDKIRDGVVLCKLGNFLQTFIQTQFVSELSYKSHDACNKDKSGFHSRSNISIFIQWCKLHIIHQSVLFDSKDCYESPHDGKRRVIICLWYLARIFGHYGAPVPQMVAYEILKNKPDRACINTYLEYKSNNKIQFDVYQTMKTQMPDIDIEDYKKKVLIEQEKQQLGQINEEYNNIHLLYNNNISTSQEDLHIEMIHDEIKVVHSEIEEIHDKIEEIHDKIEEIHDEYEEIHDKIEEIHDEYEEIHGEIEEINSEIEDVNSEIKDINSEDEDIEIHDISNEQKNYSKIDSKNTSKETSLNRKKSHNTSISRKAQVHTGGSFNAFDRAQMYFRGRRYHILVSPTNKIFVRIGGGVDSIEDFINHKTRIIKQSTNIIPEIKFKIISDNLPIDRINRVTEYISSFIHQSCLN